MLWRWNGVVERELVLKGKVDRGFVQVMSKGIAVAILLLSVMIILQVWGLNVIPLIAFGGVGAAAIGFAAKDVLSNLLGGLLLYFNRPFILGDFIHLPEQAIEGYVEEVGWNLTTIRDKDKRPVYLPNSLFSSTLVINGSRMTHRRILETVGIRYEDFGKIAALIEALQGSLSCHPDIDTHLPVLVVLNGFGDNGLNLLIDLYTLKTRYDQYLLSKHAILQLIYEHLLQAGLEMPMPTFKIVSSS
jgi:MscS family membrane protein